MDPDAVRACKRHILDRIAEGPVLRVPLSATAGPGTPRQHQSAPGRDPATSVLVCRLFNASATRTKLLTLCQKLVPVPGVARACAQQDDIVQNRYNAVVQG